MLPPSLLRFGVSISNTEPMQASVRGRFVWSLARFGHGPRTSALARRFAQLLNRAPFDVGPDALFVAYFASAELGCFLELGWPLPENVLDLYVEHRVETNGEPTLCGDGLLGALSLRGLGHIDAGEKDAMRRLVCDQHQWTAEERRKILDYCASDVDGLAAPPAADGSLHRLAPRFASRPLHEGRGQNGANRRSD